MQKVGQSVVRKVGHAVVQKAGHATVQSAEALPEVQRAPAVQSAEARPEMLSVGPQMAVITSAGRAAAKRHEGRRLPGWIRSRLREGPTQRPRRPSLR